MPNTSYTQEMGTPQVPTYDPNAAQGTAGSLAPSVPSTISSSVLTSTSPLSLPEKQPSVSPLSINASIPDPQTLINQANKATPTEDAQASLLKSIASLTGQDTSLATNQINQEQNAGIPALAGTVSQYTAKLEALNNQATDLQNQYNYTIPNQTQLSAEGRGITAAGLAPITASQLRLNQIQQGAIASQALTAKSALFAAQGQYTLAKDAADKAAQVIFDKQQQDLNYQRALLDAIQPQLNKEQKNQALLLQTQLNDRQTQITQGIQNKKDVTAQAIAAMTNNPNDPTAQYAAQQALSLDPTDPNYLSKAANLIGKYQVNPIDNQLKQAQLRNANLDYRIKEQQLGGSAPDLTQFNATQQAQLKTSGFLNYNAETQSLAQQVVNGNLAPSELSKRATGTSPYNKILAAADAYSMATTGKHFSIANAQRDYQFATNTGTLNTLTYLTSLVGTPNNPGNLDTLLSLSKQVAASPNNGSAPGTFSGGKSSGKPSAFMVGGSGTRFPALNDATQWARIQTGDAKLPGYYATLLEVSDQIAKILQGGGTGSGTSDAKLAQAQGLFAKGFTAEQVQGVVESLKPLLANRGKAIIGDNAYLQDYKQQLGLDQPSSAPKEGDTYNYQGTNYIVKNGQWVAQ